MFGLLERDGSRLFNACALVGPDGLVGSYRKIHLPFLGVDRFADPGDRPFAVHEAAGIRIGMHICYDGAFPESARVLTLLGAELLILPTNWPTHSECAAEHMMSCRSLENVVYSMAIDRVGEESGFQFIGRSSIIDTAGQRLAFASVDREEILYADIDPARARAKKLIRRPGLHEIDRIGDRRPAFYGPIGRAQRAAIDATKGCLALLLYRDGSGRMPELRYHILSGPRARLDEIRTVGQRLRGFAPRADGHDVLGLHGGLSAALLGAEIADLEGQGNRRLDASHREGRAILRFQ